MYQSYTIQHCPTIMLDRDSSQHHVHHMHQERFAKWQPYQQLPLTTPGKSDSVRGKYTANAIPVYYKKVHYQLQGRPTSIIQHTLCNTQYVATIHNATLPTITLVRDPYHHRIKKKVRQTTTLPPTTLTYTWQVRHSKKKIHS